MILIKKKIKGQRSKSFEYKYEVGVSEFIFIFFLLLVMLILMNWSVEHACYPCQREKNTNNIYSN